jgi:hypothetical protein
MTSNSGAKQAEQQQQQELQAQLAKQQEDLAQQKKKLEQQRISGIRRELGDGANGGQPTVSLLG